MRNALRVVEQVPSIETVIVLYQRDNPFYLDREKIERMQGAFLRTGKQVVYFLSTPGFWAPITTCQPRQIDVLGFYSPNTASGNCRQPPSTFSEYQDLQRRYYRSRFATAIRTPSYSISCRHSVIRSSAIRQDPMACVLDNVAARE